MHGKNIALAAVMTVVSWTGAPTNSEAGIVCKSMTWGFGQLSNKALSKGKSFSEWKANAGPGWNNVSLAKSVESFCRKEGQKWHCSFKAVPCRKLGLGQVPPGGKPGLRTHRSGKSGLAPRRVNPGGKLRGPFKFSRR